MFREELSVFDRALFESLAVANVSLEGDVVESWRGTSGDASLPADPRRQNASDLPIVRKNWENVLLEADHGSEV